MDFYFEVNWLLFYDFLLDPDKVYALLYELNLDMNEWSLFQVE